MCLPHGSHSPRLGAQEPLSLEITWMLTPGPGAPSRNHSRWNNLECSPQCLGHPAGTIPPGITWMLSPQWAGLVTPASRGTCPAEPGGCASSSRVRRSCHPSRQGHPTLSMLLGAGGAARHFHGGIPSSPGWLSRQDLLLPAGLGHSVTNDQRVSGHVHSTH